LMPQKSALKVIVVQMSADFFVFMASVIRTPKFSVLLLHNYSSKCAI